MTEEGGDSHLMPPSLVLRKKTTQKKEETPSIASHISKQPEADPSTEFTESGDEPYFSMELKVYDDVSNEEKGQDLRYTISYNCVFTDEVIQDWTRADLDLENSSTAAMVMRRVIKDLAQLFSGEHNSEIEK